MLHCEVITTGEAWSASKPTGTGADFPLLFRWAGTEKRALRLAGVSTDRALTLFCLLGWKSPRRRSQSSCFGCDFSHLLRALLDHAVRMVHFLGMFSSTHWPIFPLTIPNHKEVAPKLFLRNAFYITHRSSCTEISFFISYSLADLWFNSLIFFPTRYKWLCCSQYAIVHFLNGLEETKNK